MELKVVKEIDIKELGHFPEWVMYRNRRYTYAVFAKIVKRD